MATTTRHASLLLLALLGCTLGAAAQPELSTLDNGLRVLTVEDYSADLVLLRKVGGSYIFIHPLLQQYFALLHPSIPGEDSEAYGRSMEELATEG